MSSYELVLPEHVESPEPYVEDSLLLRKQGSQGFVDTALAQELDIQKAVPSQEEERTAVSVKKHEAGSELLQTAEKTVRVHSACLRGIEALSVEVEAFISAGLPSITIVGLPDTSVLEARSRIYCALKAAGFKLPRSHITINLAPSELKKSGTSLDLAMALAVLLVSQQITAKTLQDFLCIGELGLDGSIGEVRGQVAYELLAHKRGLKLLGPFATRISAFNDEKSSSSYYVDHLIHVKDQIQNPMSNDGKGSKLVFSRRLEPQHCPSALASIQRSPELDFSEVCDQEATKRAMMIAAIGSHGLLMVGSPGSGKSMLAKRFPSILPPISENDKLGALLIHSVLGLDASQINQGLRPFRMPHHSISIAGLIGGGRPILPGEISLAHGGVLFLDELPEFANNALQALRQPIEDGEVRLVRVDGLYTFPSKFMLLAAANPCPCGYLGDTVRECSCNPASVRRYQNKIGGPILDRIAIQINVMKPHEHKVLYGVKGLSSADMKQRVLKAIRFRKERLNEEKKRKDSHTPLDLSGLDISSKIDAPKSSGLRRQEGERPALFEFFSQQGAQEFERIASGLGLGGRAIVSAVKVARSIADLAEHELIEADDAVEACSYRLRLGGN